MLIPMLQAKLHNVTVTAADLHYVGSVSVDKNLLDASGLLANQMVQIYVQSTGARFETYVIVAPAGSGVIQLNGPAARLVQVGDKIIIAAYIHCTPAEAASLTPRVVMVDSHNRLQSS